MWLGQKGGGKKGNFSCERKVEFFFLQVMKYFFWDSGAPIEFKCEKKNIWGQLKKKKEKKSFDEKKLTSAGKKKRKKKRKFDFL
jgi:hypothetical protein